MATTESERSEVCGDVPATQRLIDLLIGRYRAADEVRRGVCLLNAGKYDEATETFERAQRLGSGDEALSTYIAACHLGSDRPDLAAEEFGRALQEEEEPSALRIRHALSLRTAGKSEEAVESLRAGIRSKPECAELHFQLGTLLAAQEQFEEAELRFTQALTIDRDHTEALVSLAMCHVVRGETAEAISFLERAQARKPHDARIGLLMAQAGRALQDKGSSIRMSASIADPNAPTDPRSVEELSRLIEADPEFVDAFLAIPTGQVDEHIFAMLLEPLRVALDRHPDHGELHLHCGRVLTRLGRREDAIDENERAVQIDPHSVRALIELARLYQATDRAADATTRLEEAIRLGAEYADVYFLLGNLYQQQGRVGPARSAYKRALALNEHYEAAERVMSALPALDS